MVSSGITTIIATAVSPVSRPGSGEMDPAVHNTWDDTGTWADVEIWEDTVPE